MLKFALFFVKLHCSSILDMLFGIVHASLIKGRPAFSTSNENCKPVLYKTAANYGFCDVYFIFVHLLCIKTKYQLPPFALS